LTAEKSCFPHPGTEITLEHVSNRTSYFQKWNKVLERLVVPQ